MSDTTGTATGPGAGDGHDDDLEPVDAVPAGSLETSSGSTPAAGAGARSGSTAVKERRPGRIRSIGTFYRQVVAELRKVIWPTRKELVTYTSVVLVFVVVMVAVVSVFDFAFSHLVLEVFGDRSL